MKSLEDAETQKKGWVGVAYNVGRIHSNGALIVGGGIAHFTTPL